MTEGFFSRGFRDEYEAEDHEAGRPRRAGARVRPLHLPEEASEETCAELRVFLGE
jgi:hypothetical protein